jgi:hypothetical protein
MDPTINEYRKQRENRKPEHRHRCYHNGRASAGAVDDAAAALIGRH